MTITMTTTTITTNPDVQLVTIPCFCCSYVSYCCIECRQIAKGPNIFIMMTIILIIIVIFLFMMTIEHDYNQYAKSIFSVMIILCRHPSPVRVRHQRPIEGPLGVPGYKGHWSALLQSEILMIFYH